MSSFIIAGAVIAAGVLVVSGLCVYSPRYQFFTVSHSNGRHALIRGDMRTGGIERVMIEETGEGNG